MHIEYLPSLMEFNMNSLIHHSRLMTAGISFILAAMLMPVTTHAESAPVLNQSARQDLAAIRTRITEFLVTQTIGYPGQVSVNAGAIDPNLKLAACPDAQVFLPPGSRAWGKTSVGVRCNAPGVWTIYVQATVSVKAQYLVAAAPLAQGRIVTSQDLIFESGDLTQLPAGVFTDPAQAIGRSVSISMTAGTVLRQEMLKIPPVVQQGQTVMVTSIGKGFSVAAEGLAMTNANDGQVVQVKIASGQVISGIARSGGQIVVGF
jgi:flagella basal body P-ring formation protein FlgA